MTDVYEIVPSIAAVMSEQQGESRRGRSNTRAIKYYTRADGDEIMRIIRDRQAVLSQGDWKE